jgi:hypothetical protein
MEIFKRSEKYVLVGKPEGNRSLGRLRRRWVGNIVTYRPIARQRPQHTSGQQYRSSDFCGPNTDSCYSARARHVLAYAVTSHNNEKAVFICSPCQVVVRDNRKCIFYMVRVMSSAGQRANRHAFWQLKCVFCAAWSVPRLYMRIQSLALTTAASIQLYLIRSWMCR